MGKYVIKCSCGHEKEVLLFGGEKERKSRIEWLQSFKCDDCNRKFYKPLASIRMEGGICYVKSNADFANKETAKNDFFKWDVAEKCWQRSFIIFTKLDDVLITNDKNINAITNFLYELDDKNYKLIFDSPLISGIIKENSKTPKQAIPFFDLCEQLATRREKIILA